MSPRLFAYTLPSSPVGEITIHHRIEGPASTSVNGLCAGIDAMREALRHLEAGRADRVIVAAVDVVSATLAALGGKSGHDAAAALVLAPDSHGMRITTASRFCAGDASAALAACVEVLATDPRDAVYAPAAAIPRLRERFATVHALKEDLLAAAPLFAVAAALRSGAESTLVVATDPSGQAGALRIERGA